MRRIILCLLLFAPVAANAQESSSGPLFMKHLLGDREFFEPWGIGFDFYTMDQDYGIKQLQIQLPGVGIGDPSQIQVANELQHFDLQFDVWLTPFLDVFAIIGKIDADTIVDLSKANVVGLPFPLNSLKFSYDGTVYGAGFNLVYGGESWFVSLNNTWTDTSLNGDFDSSVSSFTSQPRLGLIRDKWTFWVGGMYLDTEEKHTGSIELPFPGIPPVGFDVRLESLENWNYAVGVSHIFSPKTLVTFEYGFGDRTHTLFNFTYRF